MNPHFPAPKGQNVKAQGNALGMYRRKLKALKGRNLSPASGTPRFMTWDSAPSGREIISDIHPRALPWAIASRPGGAESGALNWTIALRPVGALPSPTIPKP